MTETPASNRSTRSQRTLELDPDLVSHEFSKNWVFCIPAAFKRALDIQPTVITDSDGKGKAWTQGRNFSFEVGDSLYDSQDAYGKTWAESFPHVRTCLEVVMAVPASSAFDGLIEFNSYHPKDGNLHLSGRHKCSQVEFVSLLKSGLLFGREHAEL